jgi:hypothetical protein
MEEWSRCAKGWVGYFGVQKLDKYFLWCIRKGRDMSTQQHQCVVCKGKIREPFWWGTGYGLVLKLPRTCIARKEDYCFLEQSKWMETVLQIRVWGKMRSRFAAAFDVLLAPPQPHAIFLRHRLSFFVYILSRVGAIFECVFSCCTKLNE